MWYILYSRATGATRLKHTLPDLPYEYSALEPVISREIMSLHHSKHHATYVNNLNAAEEKLAQAQAKGGTLLFILFLFTRADSNCVLSLLSSLKFNGGWHVNHYLLWCNVSSYKLILLIVLFTNYRGIYYPFLQPFGINDIFKNNLSYGFFYLCV